MKIKIIELLNLFNQFEENNSKHISSIQGLIGEEIVIKLFCHHLKESKDCDPEILKDKPTQKSRGNKNKRLDYWVKHKRILYQVEVKNWSIYSYNMNKLEYNRGKSNFESIWNSEKKIFNKNPGLEKVLLEMHIPHGLNNCKVKPLVCFWYPIRKDRICSPMLSLELNHIRFPKVYFFSASNYLESLLRKGKTNISLEMNNLMKKMELIKKTMI
jgi:hypothetical protein